MAHLPLFFGVEILKSSVQEQGFLRTDQLLKQLKPNIKQSQLLKWSESATWARYCQGPESSKLGEGPESSAKSLTAFYTCQVWGHTVGT